MLDKMSFYCIFLTSNFKKVSPQSVTPLLAKENGQTGDFVDKYLACGSSSAEETHRGKRSVLCSSEKTSCPHCQDLPVQYKAQKLLQTLAIVHILGEVFFAFLAGEA